MLAMAGALLVGCRALALDAISSYTLSQSILAYAPGGAGFAFSPHTNMAVTALGFGGVMLEDQPFNVSLWDGNGQELASVLVTANSPLVNWTHYESIPPLLLTGGQTYYLGSIAPGMGEWTGEMVVTIPGAETGTFSVAPDITYLGYATGTTYGGAFPDEVGPDQVFFLGPNLNYEFGPFIRLTRMQIASGQAQIDFMVTGGCTGPFTLLESAQPGSQWTTNQNAVLQTNVAGSSYTFIAPPAGPARFYRVRTP